MKSAWSAVALSAFAMMLMASSGCSSGATAATTVTVTMHFSQFSATTDTVEAGVPVTITLRNDDPIDHEWIVGTEDVHAAHRTGTEPFHATRPTEVTIPALSTKTTTITFDGSGEYTYICHLPGHEAYGMVRTLRVVGG